VWRIRSEASTRRKLQKRSGKERVNKYAQSMFLSKPVWNSELSSCSTLYGFATRLQSLHFALTSQTYFGPSPCLHPLLLLTCVFTPCPQLFCCISHKSPKASWYNETISQVVLDEIGRGASYFHQRPHRQFTHFTSSHHLYFMLEMPCIIYKAVN
jgi:hypothetical protein